MGGLLTTCLRDGSQVVTDTIGGDASQTLYAPGTDPPLARNGEFFLPNSRGGASRLNGERGSAEVATGVPLKG